MAGNQARNWALDEGVTLEHEAEIMRILGHPIRLRIVAGLLASDTCVKDIGECLGLAQATVSQHLSLLRAHGIVRGERVGTTVVYRVVDPWVEKLVTWMRSQGARAEGHGQKSEKSAKK